MMSAGQWIEHTSLANVMENSGFLALTVAIAHYVSFFLLVGTSVIIDLRILGMAGRRGSTAQFAGQFLPWTWASLGMAVLTGILQFLPDASIFLELHWFYAKVLLVVAGAALILAIQWNIRRWDDSRTLPRVAKLIALASILIWIITILSAVEVPQEGNL